MARGERKRLIKRKNQISAAREGAARRYREAIDSSGSGGTEGKELDQPTGGAGTSTKPATRQFDLVQCPHCAAQIRSDRLEKHLSKAHHAAVPRPQAHSTPKQTGKKTAVRDGTRDPVPAAWGLPRPPVRQKPSSPYVEAAILQTDESGRVITYSIRKDSTPEKPQRRRVKMSTCRICGIEYPANFLATHYRNIHGVHRAGRSEDFVCNVCGEKLSPNLVANHKEDCLKRVKQAEPPVTRTSQPSVSAQQTTLTGQKKKQSYGDKTTQTTPPAAKTQKTASPPTIAKTAKPVPAKQPASKFKVPIRDNHPNKNNQIVPCPICNEQMLKSSLNMHLAYAHPVCPVCNQRINKDKLSTHMEIEHPVRGKSRLPK